MESTWRQYKDCFQFIYQQIQKESNQKAASVEGYSHLLYYRLQTKLLNEHKTQLGKQKRDGMMLVGVLVRSINYE